jgi:trans-2,3-dihydro-3-hydroxyanthranilate isomerase
MLPITVGSDVATLTGGKPTLGDPLPARDLLDLVGLTADDSAEEAAAPAAAGCGLEFVILPVRREALGRAWADPARARALGVTGISVFAWEAAERTAYVRVFCPGVSVPEDPATGSAALGLGVWLVGRGWLPGEGTTSYTVHQGIEMHRPSLLECTVTAASGAATLATVSGHVVPVAQGEIAVPPFVG